MLFASWLAPLVQSIGNAFTQKTKRRVNRKSLTTQRWLANSLIERLEDRTVLSTSVTISPVFAGTIFDQNEDGTGDNDGLTYNSGGQPTVGNGAIAPFDTYDARAVAEFDISSLLGQTIESATITANPGYLLSGGPAVNWSYYTGNGNRDVNDYEVLSTSFLAVSSTGAAYALSLDVTSQLQTLIDGAASFAGFRGQRPTGPGPRIGWNAPFNLDVTFATVASFPPLTAINPLGSLAYEGTFNNALSTVGATDTLTIDLDAGQQITLVVDPSSTLRPMIELDDPMSNSIATQTAGVAGDEAVILSAPVSTAGTYTIRVTGASSTTGSYSLRLILNAAVEDESHGGADNGTILAAQNIDSSFVTVGSGAVATVLGTTDFGPLPSEFEPNDTTATANPASANFATFAGDRFQMMISGAISTTTDVDVFNIGALQAGDVLTLTNSGSDSSRGTISDAILELYRSNGGSPVLVTKDDDSGPGEDSLIDHFTVTDADTYFVLATNFSTETGTYQLGIFLENSGTAPSTGGALVTETAGNNNFVATADDASTSWRAVNLLAQSTGSITTSDVDVYQYLFNAGDLVTVEIDSTSSLDARVSLLDASGVVVASEDGTSIRPGADVLNSSLYAFRIPSSGTYFVQVDAASGTGSYDADVYLSAATAPAVSILDLYAFTLTAGQSVSLVLEGLTAGNVDLALVDSTGATLATGSVGASNVDEFISNFVASALGTYYAQVTGVNSVDYSLVVVRDAGFDLEANDSFATAQILNGGVLGHVAGQDWYQFFAGIGDTITLATATPGDGANEFVNDLDPFIELYDPSGAFLDSDDGSGAGLNSLLTFTATSSGMHRVRLTGVGGSTGEYFLSASVTNNASPTVSITANDATAAEPSDNGQFTISLTDPSSSATTVNFTVTGSASGTDYTSLGTSVVIPANATSVTLNVALFADTLVEGDETVIVTLTGVSGDSGIVLDPDAVDRTATVTISDTEDTATVSITANDATATEPSDNGQFTISLTNPSNTDTTVFFTVTGTANDGTDFATLGASVVIPANATSVMLDVSLLADVLVEGDETVIVTLGSVSGDPQISLDLTPANLTATVTIFDNDFDVTVAVAPGSVAEDGGSNLVYTFTRSGSTTNPLTVQFGVGGVAVFGTDYSQSGAASFGVSSGSVVILAGDSTATVTIDPTPDLTVETNETVELTVSADSAYQVGSPNVATGTITDNDSAVFSITDASGVEGAGVTFTITLSAAVDVATSVKVTTTNGSATTADNDYTAVTSQEVSFAAGQTSQTITIDTTGDNKVEGDETFTATLGELNNGGLSGVTISGASTATGTITNDDAAVFSIANSSATEGSGVIFTITLSNPVDVATSVTFTTADGTATLGDNDYTAVTTQTVNFAAGDTTQTITVNTTADTTVEVDETFTATLAGLNAGGRAVSISSSNGAATGTITNDESAVFSIADSSSVEGGGITFTITLSKQVDVATSVTFTTSNGTATTGDSDYSAVTAQTVAFAAGETSHTITVNTTTDNKVEANETFTATLGGLSSGGRSVTISGTNGAATGTITNDDAAVFSIADSSATEGSGVIFTITLSNPVDVATSVTVMTTDGSATTADNDYVSVSSQLVSFAAGVTSQTITISTVGDTQVEGTETFLATLGGLIASGRSVTISGTNDSATGTITDNDSAVFSIADASASEGNGVTFTITLSNPVDVETSVTLTTANGSATLADSDYTAVTSQTVTFAPGQTTQMVTIDTTADTRVEGDETFTATLGDLSDGGRSVTISGTNDAATGTILNDDGAIFSISDADNTEGNGIVFTITLSQPVDVETSVTVTTADGTATLGDNDYTAVTTQTVTFAAGLTSQMITVNTTADATFEPHETFTATLGDLNDGGRDVSISGSNGAATGTILNDDGAIFSIADVAEIEGTGITFTVTLSAAVDVDTSVTVTTSNGTATLADGDYTAVTSQTVTFLAGETLQTITVNTTSDNKVEANETFTVTLGGLNDGGRNVTISATNGSAIGTITNDDAAVFSIADSSATEGSGVIFTITLSNPADVATSVTFSTSNGTATLLDSDYTAASSQTVSFAAGETTQTITVNTTADNKVEANESFTATLGGLLDGGRSVTISGAAGSATGTITNNDSAVFSIADASAIEGSGVTFTITLSNEVDVATSVTFTTSNGTATTADSDYSAVTTQTVAFAAGETSHTVTVNTTTDNKVEADETFTATLGGLSSGGRSVTISGTNGAATGTITNNDSAVFSIANVSAFEGVGLAFMVTLSNPVDVATSVTFTTSDGTATVADSDYSAIVAQLVSFAAGVTSQTMTVNTISDLKVELDETMTATLGNLNSGGRSVTISGANGAATGTIFNDNTEVSVSVSPGSVVEDGLAPLVYTFTRIGVVAGTLTANFTVGGSAALSDYSPTGAASFTATTGTVVFAGGSSTATVTITPTVDSSTEFDETVVLSVAAGTGYAIGTTSSATGTIRDDDAQISLSVSPSSVSEDGAPNLAYTFSRFGSTSGTLVVNFNVGGTAMFGPDFSTANTTSFTATTGSITFAPGASSVTMFVDPATDNAIEADESVSITLSTGSGYLPPSLTPVVGTIDNDEFEVSMALTPVTLAEDAPGTFAYSFSRTGGLNRSLSVQILVGGTALAGFDYSQTGAAPFSASGGIVTFASGASTATLLIDPIVDTGIEVDETVEVTLLSGSGYTATGTTFHQGTITNDDQLVSLSSATASVTEDGSENLVVVFTRTGATAGALSIPMTLGGTATFNTDYAPTGDATFSSGASQLLFAAGVTTATLTFNPVADSEMESSEVLLLTLAKDARLGVPVTIVSTGSILNDDATVTVSVTPARVPEEGTSNLVYTFQRFGDTSQAATVNFSVSGSAMFETDYSQSGAASFTSTSGTIIIPAGRSDATLTLDPTPDGLNEANETAIVTILPSLGFTPSGDPALGTIVNQVTNVALSVTPTQLPENSTSNLLYQFTRTGSLLGELTVQFSVSGSATFEADYLQSGSSSFTATEGSITFANGAATATLTIDPQSDSLDELTETVVVTILPDAELYNITGAGTATTSITDTAMISLAVSPGSVTENGVPNLLFTFSRSGSTKQELTVSFSVAGSASFGTDYAQSGATTFSASVGTVKFLAGSATTTVTINPTADFTIEADETVILTVVSGNGYLIAGDSTATGIIANDDLDIGNVITLDATGRLHITDTVGRDDRLRVFKNTSNELVITDSVNPLTTTVGRQVTAQEVRVPLGSISTKVLIVELNGGADRIDLAGIPAASTTGGVVVNLLNVTVYGGSGDDTIIGSAGSDTLLGGDGNDSIDGGSGNDGISGDAGNDKLNGNSGNDSIMGGTGNDYMLGGAGNDRMVGQSGGDTVIGQGGIDRIAGGSGFGSDPGDVVTDLNAEIDEAFSISFNGTKFLLI